MENNRLNKITWELGPAVVLVGPNDEDTDCLLSSFYGAVKQWALDRGYVLHPDRLHIYQDEISEERLEKLTTALDADAIIVSLPMLANKIFSLEEENNEN